jgi:hypothetical protein
MQPEFRERLPANVLALLDKIEAAAGQEIRVEANPHPVSPTDPSPEAMAASVGEDAATIYIRSPELFVVQGALHELLHIERYWVKRVPQILPTADAFDADRISITSDIENCLEHLVIVPEEAKYGFEPFGYWNKTFAANWGSHPWPDMKNSWSRRKNCLLGWMTTSCLATDEAVKALASSAVQAEGHWLEAQKFAAKVVGQVVGDKAGALATVVRFLQIPPHEVELVTFDPKMKQRKVEKLSRH